MRRVRAPFIVDRIGHIMVTSPTFDADKPRASSSFATPRHLRRQGCRAAADLASRLPRLAQAALNSRRARPPRDREQPLRAAPPCAAGPAPRAPRVDDSSPAARFSPSTRRAPRCRLAARVGALVALPRRRPSPHHPHAQAPQCRCARPRLAQGAVAGAGCPREVFSADRGSGPSEYWADLDGFFRADTE